MQTHLFSEPYGASGGLAADGILNQLGRPDMEALEVLVREAVQNSWDAKRGDSPTVTVHIGRVPLDGQRRKSFERLFSKVPPGLPLSDQLGAEESLLYFADFGTSGLAGPTRADRPGLPRDFIDFVLNIGQPPDREMAAGSFGYGKAAFYLASRARTVIIDTLCDTETEGLERRLIACGLGTNFQIEGRPFTGRHWWGSSSVIPSPLTGDEAEAVAGGLGLPDRRGPEGRGTTVAIVSPSVTQRSADQRDETMDFLGQCVAWNFWPKMIDTPYGVRRSLQFKIVDGMRNVQVPSPRTHPVLRGFVEALDHLRTGDEGVGDLLQLHSIERRSQRREKLGALAFARVPSAATPAPTEQQTLGQRTVAHNPHHVALMRTPEIVVKYLEGEAPVAGRMGYAGVFLCTPSWDEAFKRGEPPAHDDWVATAISDRAMRLVVAFSLRRIRELCRILAGVGGQNDNSAVSDKVPLGEFADQLAGLMPAMAGTGARRPAHSSKGTIRRRRRSPLGREDPAEVTDRWLDVEVKSADGHSPSQVEPSDPSLDAVANRDTDTDVPSAPTAPPTASDEPRPRPRRRPQVKMGEGPRPMVASDGTPVVAFPFQVKGNGNTIRLKASVEVMTNDGRQVESDAPIGEDAPRVHAWVNSDGRAFGAESIVVDSSEVDGDWQVQVPITSETMMRVDIGIDVL